MVINLEMLEKQLTGERRTATPLVANSCSYTQQALNRDDQPSEGPDAFRCQLID